MVKGSKVYSFNLITSKRDVIKEFPNYVARLHTIKKDGDVVLYAYEPMYNDEGRPYMETEDSTCDPIKSFPG